MLDEHTRLWIKNATTRELYDRLTKLVSLIGTDEEHLVEDEYHEVHSEFMARTAECSNGY